MLVARNLTLVAVIAFACACSQVVTEEDVRSDELTQGGPRVQSLSPYCMAIKTDGAASCIMPSELKCGQKHVAFELSKADDLKVLSVIERKKNIDANVSVGLWNGGTTGLCKPRTSITCALEEVLDDSGNNKIYAVCVLNSFCFYSVTTPKGLFPITKDATVRPPSACEF